MEIQVISSVNINISQEDLEQMIMDKIAAHDSNIIVESLEFVQRRNPTRMDVDVKAHYGSAPVVKPEPAPVAKAEEPVSKEVLEEPETEPQTVGDIFGDS